MDTCLKCPITALKVTGDVLLSGQGSKLVIYKLNDKSKLISLNIFISSRIHKFIECKHVPGLWLVVGGKSARCIKLEKNDDNYHVVFLCDEKVFKAWLWDAYWITEESLLFISSHNTVLYWNPFINHTSVVSSCIQQCILYCATFSLLQDELVVAVGTVFNKVLLWKPGYSVNTEHDYKEIYKTFDGHEGVIFRVRFRPSQHQMLSVSDDRSIRLWSVTDETCLHVLYGHTARVWDAQYTDENIVSIGEDAMCILWNLQGHIVKKYGGHKGKSIWSLDVHDDVIITGGGDGAIRMWNMKSEQLEMKGAPLELSLPMNDELLDEKSCEDYPRTVKFINQSNLIVFSNKGILWNYYLPSDSWTVLHQDERFSSYCCLDISSDLVAIGNLKGLVKIINISKNPACICEEQLFSGKVFSIFWLSVNTQRFLLACGPAGEIKVLALRLNQNEISLSEKYQFTCPHSRQCWIAAVDIIASSYQKSNIDGDISDIIEDIVLICGDRRGSMHLFSPKSKDPFQSILGVHGKTGVTQVMARHDYVYSTGRDGAFRKYKYDSKRQQLHLIDKQKACKGMDWIEGVWFKNSDIIIYGFYMQSHFATWNYETNELLFKIKCGGGYRSWDVVFPNMNEEESLGFSYVKGAQLNLVSYNWRRMDHDRIIEESLHGREVMAVKVLGKHVLKDVTHWLLATCSEDTTINFLIYNDIKRSMKSLHTAVGHIGGVKDICFVPLKLSNQPTNGSTEQLFQGCFISSGSRTSLKVWILTDNVFTYINDGFKLPVNNLKSLNHEFSCSLISEIYNPETTLKKLKLKDRTLIDDMRYLSCDAFLISDLYPEIRNLGNFLCCVCACSDGVVRIYTFNDSAIELLTSLDCDKHCVLTVKICTCFFNNSYRIFLFNTATNGLIYIWNITSLLKNHVDRLFNSFYKKFNQDNEVSIKSGNKFVKLINYLDKSLNSDDEIEIAVKVECDVEIAVDINEENNTREHINKYKYKFHDLNAPLWNYDEACLKVSTHQSGVNAIDVYEITNGLLLVSGGDDSCVCITKLFFNGDNLEVGGKSSNPSAHISSISAIVFINESLVVSTSVDQRIKFWSIEDVNLLLIHEIVTNIADVSNMEIWISSGVVHIAVTGVGVEIFSIPMEQLNNSDCDININAT